MKPRTSPVIWNGAGPLDRQQQEAYAADGFIFMKNVLDAELISLLREEVETLRSGRYPSTILERDKATVRSVFDAHTLNQVILDRIVKHSLLLDVSEQILGCGLYVHQCHVNFKSPGGGGFAWHSDFTFWFWEDGMPEPRAISIFIFLDPARTETGPLCVIPGSHRFFTHTEWYRRVDDPNQAVRHDDEAEADAWQNGLVDRDTLASLSEGKDIVTIWGNPGDVLITDANLVHASGANFGVHDRRVLLLILNNIGNKTGMPMSGGPERPDYISSRRFDVVR